ncbi:ribonuclease III [Chloroflexota bacterium]
MVALADLASLQKILGVRFKDPSLLQQALIHSSYTNENPGIAPVCNERLEFLGDAVLGAAIAEKLYQFLPDAAEGEMTRLRATLVSRKTLSRLAKSIGLDEYLYMGKGEEGTGGRQKTSNLAGALEAVIAAVFLDRGWDSARDFVLRLFQAHLDELDGQPLEIDYKSKLQQLIQSQQQQPPIYRITETSGPSHQPLFTAEVVIDAAVLGRGYGKSKKLAETEAARLALEGLE